MVLFFIFFFVLRMKTEVLCLVVFCSVVSATSTVGYVQSSVSSYNFVARSNNSTLYNLTLSNDPYQVGIKNNLKKVIYI